MNSVHWVENARFRHVIEDFVVREREAVEAYVASGGEE
jgi:predicted N-acyltransferase